MDYDPQPIDTSAVVLGPNLEELIGRLAKNIHDNWARRRKAEGWTLGPNRDDQARTHPNLIPYEELDDSDKDYDRLSVTETLRVLIALGYAIEKRSSSHE